MAKDCSKANIMLFLSMITGIIISIVIITSINNIEKSNCECAKLPQRRFLKEWFVFFIFYEITLLLLFSFNNETCWDHFVNYPFIYGSIIIVALIDIIMIIRLFLYIRLLRNNCSCGYGNKEAFIYWFLFIEFSVFAFLFVLLLLVIILTAIKFF